MSGAPLIRLENAALGYGRRAVLQDVSCAVHAGECVGIVGPNGAGKTTFLRAVLGFLRPTAGRLTVDRTKTFAYVPQQEEINTLWPLRVKDVVFLGDRAKRPFGRIAPEERRAAEEVMEDVGIAPIADALFAQVSGGQRQRTILAQALAQRPDVLLLDEPTRGLDVVAEKDLLAIVRRLKGRLTILLVTHTLQIPLNFTERILLFKGGRLFDTTAEELTRTSKLEEIYGTPFLQQEHEGFRWVAPREMAP